MIKWASGASQIPGSNGVRIWHRVLKPERLLPARCRLLAQLSSRNGTSATHPQAGAQSAKRNTRFNSNGVSAV
jgi:hypothetical protein